MHPDEASSPNPARLARHARAHRRLIATVAVCAFSLVMSDPPGRLDLWTAELAGTFIVIAAAPFIAMRILRVDDSMPVLALAVAITVALACARSDDAARQDQRLPTASDGFGAYARLFESSRNS